MTNNGADGDGVIDLFDTDDVTGDFGGDFSTPNDDGDDTDGVPDYLDTDSDGDGKLDYLDIDADNDGITDTAEAGMPDADGDGQVDDFSDPNGDGFDSSKCPFLNPAGTDTPLCPENLDSDDDGTPNHLDIDADDDGIPDNIEAQTTVDYVVPTGKDTDGDGLDDAYDTNNGGTPVPLVNSDVGFDTLPDYLDIDSDNDGLSDLDEAARGTVTGQDSDGDGLDDGFDQVSGPDPTDSLNSPAEQLPNADTDVRSLGGDVDYREQNVAVCARRGRRADSTEQPYLPPICHAVKSQATCRKSYIG